MPLRIGKGPWCGTAGGYNNHSCRCADCTEAWRIYHAEYMRANPERLRRQREAKKRKVS